MTLDIVIPVFNEERRLTRCIPVLHAFLTHQTSFEWRIVVANNGSTDRTQEVAETFCRQYSSVTALWLPEKGRGRALKRAWLESDAEVLAYMDVDLATGLDALPSLVGTILSGRADVTTGSRLLPESRIRRSWRREVISRAYVLLVRAMCGTDFSDIQCGFKAISREAAQVLLPQVRDCGWFFDTELLVWAKHTGWRVAELPVQWKEDGETRVKILQTAWRDFVGVCRLRRQLRASGGRMALKGTQPANLNPSD